MYEKNKFSQKFKEEVVESYRKILFSLFFFIGKKLFTVVSTISPNNKDTFIIFSNDAKLNELVKNVATPNPQPSPIFDFEAPTKKSAADLKKSVMSVQSELNRHEKQINECIRKTDILEIVVYGKDGSNGLRAKVKELDDYIDDFKPRLAELNRIYNVMEDIKKNVVRVIWVIVTSSILALGSRFVQIKIEDQKIEKAVEARSAERALDNTQRQDNFKTLENSIRKNK